jgi:hypothetical protein
MRFSLRPKFKAGRRPMHRRLRVPNNQKCNNSFKHRRILRNRPIERVNLLYSQRDSAESNKLPPPRDCPRASSFLGVGWGRILAQYGRSVHDD